MADPTEQSNRSDDARRARAVRDLLIDAGFSSPRMNVLNPRGYYVTNFARSLGASDTLIGLLTAVASLASLSQLGASYIIERVRRTKPLCVTARLLSRLLWPLVLGLCFAPFLSFRWRIYALILGGGLVQMLQSAAYVSWLSWVKDLIPQQVRGAFLGLRGMWMNLVAVVTALGVAQAIDTYSARAGGGGVAGAMDVPQAFFWPFMTVVGLALLGTVFLFRVPEAPMVEVAHRPPFSQLLREALADRNLRLLLISHVLWLGSARLVQPFLALFLRQELGLRFLVIQGLEVLMRLTNSAQQRWWGPMADRFGNRPVLLLAQSMMATTALLWIGVNHHTLWALLPLIFIIRGTAGAGLQLSRSNLILSLSPEENPSIYIAAFNSLASLATFVVPLFGGGLLDGLKGAHLSLGSLAVTGLQALLAVNFLMRAVAIWLLRGVSEENSRGVRHFAQAMARSHSRNPVALMMRAADAPRRLRHWRARLRRRRRRRRR